MCYVALANVDSVDAWGGVRGEGESAAQATLAVGFERERRYQVALGCQELHSHRVTPAWLGETSLVGVDGCLRRGEKVSVEADRVAGPVGLAVGEQGRGQAFIAVGGTS